MANIAYLVPCPTCPAQAGEPCLAYAKNHRKGEPHKKATENHKPRVRAAEEYNARLDTPDTETADEFSEDRDPAEDMTLDELADAIERATLWEWVTALDEDLRTPDEIIEVRQ